MTKLELQAKIEALQSALDTKMQESKAYQGQLDVLQEQLKDINKPKLTPLQFDELHDTITDAVSQFDFDDSDNYDMDFHIDYDNRIAVESMSFLNADEIVREIYSNVSELFAEQAAPEDEISTQEHLNQD
tara:strand:+ start:327 stop:716 length:390 start_codon:yes stop_codon:yes gene_type:complete